MKAVILILVCLPAPALAVDWKGVYGDGPAKAEPKPEPTYRIVLPVTESWDERYARLRKDSSQNGQGFILYFGCDPERKTYLEELRAPDSEREFFKIPKTGKHKFVAVYRDGQLIVEGRYPIEQREKMPIPKGGDPLSPSPSSGYVAPVKPRGFTPARGRFLGGGSSC